MEHWFTQNGYILDIPSFTSFSGLGFHPCQRLRLAYFPGVGRGLQASGALRNLSFWSSSFLESHSLCMGKESWFHILRGYRSWGDLLRSVPFIMCGHLNIEFFQASAASILTRYPLRTCPMMILRHSGRAPKPFVHPLHGMSHHEMSGHDTQNLKLLFWSISPP